MLKMMSWIMSWIRKLISRTSTPIEQETLVIGDDRNSLITQESDSDNELEHDEMPPQNRQRNTDEQAIVIYGQEQGSSSNSILSLLFNWAFSDPSLNEKKKTLVDKWLRLLARRDDVKKKLKDDEDQPGKRPRKEVQYWLNAVEEKYNEISQGSSSHSNLSSGRIQKFIEQVDDLYQMGLFPNGLVLEDQKSTRVPLWWGKKPVGKNVQENTAKILGWLKNEKHCIIGVYGMGGVGKTTLLKQIYDQLLKDASLDRRVYWVEVSQSSQSFSVDKLQQDIAQELGLKGFEMSRRAATLHDKLSAMDGNVLILDNMWKAISVAEVGIPVEGSGCKVILSTRSREVCLKMGCKNLVIKAEILSDEEAWDLFVDYLGFGHYNTLEEEAKEIARCIAKECGGLPLAIITMARSMRANVDINGWKVDLYEVKSLRNHCDMKEDVFEKLKFSYDRLENNRIQNCFLSCLLFGEDEKIRRKDLIDMWINEGLFDEIESREYQKAKGHSILNKLESWCLLESAVRFPGARCVKMHDLVRDMAISITKEHPRFLAKASENLKKVLEEQWSNDLVKVSLSHNWIEEIPSGMAPKTTNLTVLMLNGNILLKEIPELFFQHMEALKVLDLSDTSIERVPESVSDLENLRALLLNSCMKLEYVPSVTKLTKLRVLGLNECYELKAAPRGLERLKSVELVGYCPWDISNMRDFSKFILQSSGSSLRSFHFWIRDPALFTEIYVGEKLVAEIKGRVLITGWEYREEESSWMLPKTLEELKIEKSDMKGRSLVDVLPSLNKATNVKKIELKECRGMISITKVGGKLDSFSHLTKLEISGCGNMKVVFPFTEHPPHLPNLEYLRVYECEEVEEIFQSNERASQCVSPPQSNPIIFSLPNLWFLQLRDLPKLKLPITEQLHLPNLKILRVINCEKVEEIFHSTDRDSQSNPISLPNLEELCLEDLPKVKAILSNLYIDVPKLTSLELIKLPKLKLPITEKLPLPNLEELTVEDCEEVEEIFQIYNPNPALPNLKKVTLGNLPKLKRVFPFTEQLHQIPNLKELRVFDCEEVEEIFQIYNPNLGLPNFSLLRLQNLPKLKWVFPVTFTEQLRQLPNLEKLRVEDCEEVEEIFRLSYNPNRDLPNSNFLNLENLPKLRWVFPFTEHPLHLVQLKYIKVLNCSMLHSICRGLILIPHPCVRDFCVKNCPKLKGKVFKIISGNIIVDSKSTVKCMLNNTQFWEKLQQNFPDQAHLLSTFMSQGMELSQGLDDENDDGCGDGNGDGNGAEGMELWQGLDENNDGGGGDGDSDSDGGEGDVGGYIDDDKTKWSAFFRD